MSGDVVYVVYDADTFLKVFSEKGAAREFAKQKRADGATVTVDKRTVI